MDDDDDDNDATASYCASEMCWDLKKRGQTHHGEKRRQMTAEKNGLGQR